MESSIKKSKLTAIILLATLMTSTFLLMSVVPVQAQQTTGPIPDGVTPDGTVDTQIYMSFRPNPVGLGQTFLVNLYTVPAPGANRLHEDFTVTITKPSGDETSFTMNSYPDDGTAWFEWIADEVGDWTIQFDFLGTYFPAGIYMDGEMVPAPIGRSTTTYDESVYFLPVSTGPESLTVQEDMVYSWPEAELPTDYWTRPVAYEYREWWPILGDYPWRGPATSPLFETMYPDTNPVGRGGGTHNFFTAWVEGPESAHVVWKRECQIAGILGGDQGVKPAEANLFAGNGMGSGAYANGKPDVIYQGKAYEVVTTTVEQIVDGTITYVPSTMLQCYDIRTGEVFWETSVDVASIGFGPYPTVYYAPTEIEYEGIANPGGGGDAQQSASVSLIMVGQGHLMKWRPMTGELFLDVSLDPISGGTYYRNGYCLTVQTLGNGEHRLLNWTTFGTSASFASRIVSNVTFPWSSLPDTTDYNVGIASRQVTVTEGGAYVGLTIGAASVVTGELLWEKTITDLTQYSTNTNNADHGMIAVLTGQGTIKAWSLYDGSLVWTTEQMDYPWDAASFGAYSIHSAYGKLIWPGYSGVYAFDWNDGSLAWKYEAPAEFPYETPYIDADGNTMYSWNNGGTIADGKLYIYNTEHSATVPITRGWKMHCIDIASGEQVWSTMIAGGSSKHLTDLGPVADGYLTLAASDGYMYVFGKGQSETTITAPNVAVPVGTSMVITGTVLDTSPAQPGTPCVSVGSMGAQMEYIHHQMPLEGIHGDRVIEGVEVLLTAVASDGSCTDLGTTVTNGYYGTYGFTWTPETEGTYEIIASFAGDASYGSSAAATTIAVGPSQTPATPIEPDTPATNFISTELAIALAAIVACIIGAVAFFVLRKRK
jgi:hypothetical protein